MELTHFNEQGRARMVDVSEKAQTYRVARAAATVNMARATMEQIKAGTIGEIQETSLHIYSEVRCHGETGVEMEALTAVSTAALTVYDMCKAVQRDMSVTDIHLLYKAGGKSGIYEAEV